jgi:lysozyme
MNLSPLGIALIQLFEEYISKAYKRFPTEPWTAGWGHTRGVTENTVCTPQIALDWLKEDVAEAEKAVSPISHLSQHQYDALVSLVYNIGVGAFERSKMLSHLYSDPVAAAEDFLDWDHIGGVPNAGLLRRRTFERALYLYGDQ